MFKHVVLVLMVSLAGAESVYGQRPGSQIAQHVAQVTLQGWTKDANGADVEGAVIYSVPGAPGKAKVDGASKAKAIGVGILGAFVPTSGIVNVDMNVVIPAEIKDEKSKNVFGGSILGFTMFFYSKSALPADLFYLVRLDAGKGRRSFMVRYKEETKTLFPDSSCDLTDRVRMEQLPVGDWVLRLVAPLEAGEYAVVSLRNDYLAFWDFSVPEGGLAPQKL